jgi:aryl-alcohol dehydrogenase-like predicted oxidoreductase
MRYQPIPQIGLRPSVLCLGTADMGSKIDRATSFRLLDIFVSHGGNFLDTAQVYADWLPGERSISEKTLGEWLSTRGNRREIVLATKGAHPQLETMHRHRMTRADIVHDLDASLRNLRTDVVDLYWLHRDALAVPVGEIIAILNDQVRAGKIRAFGCSNWATARIEAAQAYATAHGLQGFSANQPLWNIGVPDLAVIGDPTLTMMDETMRHFHQQTGVAAVPYSSQANGLFSRLASGKTAQIKPATERVYHLPENQRRVERIRQLVQQSGLTPTQIVLGYLLGQPFPVFPIIGCQTVAQLEESLTAGDVQLTREQIGVVEG